MEKAAKQKESVDLTKQSSAEDDGQTVTPALRVSQFVDHLGERFDLETGEQRGLTLTLVEARALATAAGALREDPFVLLFRAPRDCGLGQGLVRLNHRETGPVELFLVPIAGDGEDACFEAIFN